MRTKYFMAKIEKGMDGGQIIVKVVTVHFYEGGVCAESVCSPGSSGGGNKYGWATCLFVQGDLRTDKKWGADYVGAVSMSTKRFNTGVEAGRWYEEIRQHLISLDHHVDHLSAEIATLPD